MVLPASSRVSRAPPYSGSAPTQPDVCRVRDFHPLSSPFPVAFHYTSGFYNCARSLASPPMRPFNPWRATAQAYHALQVWALPPSLAATRGISIDFFSSRYLDGSVPWVCLHTATCSPYSEFIAVRRKAGELKHLSTLRRRN